MTSRRWIVSACICVTAVLTAIAFGTRAHTLAEQPMVPVSEVTAQEQRVDIVGADLARGAPVHVERYAPEEQGAHRQFWDAVQGHDGRLYAANTNGVLEYDGATWRLVPTYGLVRSVMSASNGRIYVGTETGMGVLEADSLGFTTYRELLSDEDLGGDAAWGIFEADGAIVVQTFGQLVRLESGRPVGTVRAPDGVRFHKAFDLDGRLIVRQERAGLMEYAGGALRAVPGGEAFSDVSLRALLDLDGEPGGAWLAVTDDTLFRFENGTATPLPSAAGDVLRDGRAYHGCRLGAGDEALFALTTLGQGALVVNADGVLVQHLGAESGLMPDDFVLGCTVDAQGGLWLALSDGISRIDVAAPFSVFDTGLGLPGAVYSVTRHEGVLYVATEFGVFRQSPGERGRPARFEPVAPALDMSQSWTLTSTPDGLLVGSTGGVYAINGDTVRRIMDGPVFSFVEDGEGRMLAGLKDGIAVLNAQGGWRETVRLPVADGEIRALIRIGDAVWGMERDGRLLRIEGGRVRAFGPESGVPQGVVTLQSISGTLTLITADKGIFEVVPERLGTPGGARARPDLTRFAREAAGGDAATDAYSIGEDETGRVWVSGRARTFALERRGAPGAQGESAWHDVTPAALRQTTDILPVYTEPGVTYVGTATGLYRLVNDGSRYEIGGQALVRELTTEDGGPAFGGTPRADGEPVSVPYGQALRFAFALPAFNDAPDTRYRSELLGFDRRTNDWSEEHARSYTNLPPGSYTFRVEAQTAQGGLSRPATLSVRILPPWYLSAWAFAGYVLGALSVIFGVAYVSSRHERRKTEAAQARARELAALNEQLREADRLKDDMLANTSHELRTPLTAIIGFSELLTEYEGGNAAEVRTLAEHMYSGGRRLLRTVTDLLDIAQLRAGKLQLKPQVVDAAAVVRGVAAELQPLAAEKGLVYTVHPADLVAPATLDPDALARVLTNLVSNAIKFTDTGGVAILVDVDEGDLTVAVQDSGCGIAPAFMPRLFDEYVQESTGDARRAEGSGLGLAITRRVVSLMDGTIEIQSEPGQGTRATIRLPLNLLAGAVLDPSAQPERRPAEPREPLQLTLPDVPTEEPAALPDAHA